MGKFKIASFVFLLIGLVLLGTPQKSLGQSFLPEDRIAVADSIHALISRLNRYLTFDHQDKAHPDRYKQNLGGLFYNKQSLLPNIAIPDTIHADNTISIGHFLEKSIDILSGIYMDDVVFYFNSNLQTLRRFSNELEISRKGLRGHTVSIPITFINFESRIIPPDAELDTLARERINRLSLTAEIFFLSKPRSRSMFGVNPRNVYAFQIANLQIQSVPATAIISGDDMVVEGVSGFSKQETDRIERLIMERINNISGDITDVPPLLGLIDPFTNRVAESLQFELLGFFADPDQPGIHKTIFSPYDVEELISPSTYVQMLVNEDLRLTKLLRDEEHTHTFSYQESAECRNLMHIILFDRFQTAGSYRSNGGMSPPFQEEVGLYFQFDVLYQQKLLGRDKFFTGIPAIVGITKTRELVTCEAVPPKWNFSFGARYLHDYNFFNIAGQHQLSDYFSPEWVMSNNAGVDFKYHRLAKGKLGWAIGGGFQYRKMHARISSEGFADKRMKTHPSFDNIPYEEQFTATDLLQSLAYTSMSIPLSVHVKYDIGTRFFIDAGVGAQLCMNSGFNAIQHKGQVVYSGLFHFFDGQSDSYLLENIEEYGFTNFDAKLIDEDIHYNEYSIGLIGNLTFARRLSASIPLYLEFGPHAYYGLSKVFEPANGNEPIILGSGENQNYFSNITNGENYFTGFFIGLRYFIR